LLKPNKYGKNIKIIICAIKKLIIKVSSMTNYQIIINKNIWILSEMQMLIVLVLLSCISINGYNDLVCTDDYCYCPNVEMNQREQPSYNGCGPKNNHIATPSNWEFDEVCDEHDICYGTCGSSKQECDNILGDDLVMKCVNNVPTWPGQTREYCILTAGSMHEFVKDFGKQFFEDAQQEYCECASF